MASYSNYEHRFARHARDAHASSHTTPARRPRPAQVEDFEGSEAEFAPRVVDARAGMAPPARAEAEAEALPAVPDVPPFWDARPPTPPGYDAEPSLRCGRSSTRDSAHGFSRTGDRPMTPTSRSATPSTATSVRGILKTGRDCRTSFEKSRTRSESRVRFSDFPDFPDFPDEPAGGFRRSARSDSPERTQRPGRSPSASSERSSTGAVIDDAEYRRPRGSSHHHARAHGRDSHDRDRDHDYVRTPDYRVSVNYSSSYSSSRAARVHTRVARPLGGEYQRRPFEPLAPFEPFDSYEEPQLHYSWQAPYSPARRAPAPAAYAGAHEFQPQSPRYRAVQPVYREQRPRSSASQYETRRPVFADRPRPNSSPDLPGAGELYGDWTGTYYF